MPTGNEPYTLYNHGWMMRIRRPKNPAASRVLLLLHGWTGDETVMWIFTRSLPDNYWILAPRGPVQSPESGYGWLENHARWPKLPEFKGVTNALMQTLPYWAQDLHLPNQPLDVMGFSQGAAMAYALTAYYPQHISRVVALAGFLPLDETMPGHYNAFSGKKVYIAHGTKDETVPVEMAHSAVQTLESVGAQVNYCESDAGHKLSAGCLRGLTSFLE